jgi:hypothetical protein
MPDEIPLPLLRWACGCLRGEAGGVSVLLHIRIHVDMGCRMRPRRQMLRIRLHMYGLARDGLISNSLHVRRKFDAS